MKLTIVFVIFIYGAVLGSFYNVVGLRVPKSNFFKSKRSFCLHCHHQLTILELIPLVSFVLQRGKCKNCKTNLSFLYPIIECITGLLFAVSHLTFGNTLEFLYTLLFISFLIVLSISDMHYMIIPNQYFFIFGIPLVIFQIVGLKISILTSFLGLFVVLGILCIVYMLNKGKMGMGDVKLFLLIGFLIGPELVPLVLLLSSLSASVYFIYLLIWDESNLNRKIPFGPFISLGTIIVLFYGETLLNFVYSYSLT